MKQIEVEGSHADIGLEIGQHFKEDISQAFDSVNFFLDRYIQDAHTIKGKSRYQSLVEIHLRHFPDFFTECEKIAHGAGISFMKVFLMNMRGEYQSFLQQSDDGGCSDCALLTNKYALFGHNEDGNPDLLRRSYLVHARISGKPAFTAFSYPGFLCGNAFGFNEEGICFSVDNVLPKHVQIGIGRHFIARSLFEARSLKDAIERVTIPGRASGFSYTIGSISERRIVQVEVSPSHYQMREIRGMNFHANHYLDLDAEQTVHPSSGMRVERFNWIIKDTKELSPGTILEVLGDRESPLYPIYRQARHPDKSATFCTALFDLDRRQLKIYLRNPSESSEADINLNI